MDDGEGGRWTEPPPLPRVPDPPIGRVVVRGAQLVRIYAPLSKLKPDRLDGGRDAVILAWAQMSGGGWAVLLTWAGYWLGADNHQTDRPRWGWVQLVKEMVEPQPPRQYEDPDRRWHGHYAASTMDQAVEHGALELPRTLREAALTPRPWPESANAVPQGARDPVSAPGDL